MAESTKSREQSPLVKAVLALDNYFSELGRLGTKINSLDMKSDFDFEQAQRLVIRFAECGQGVSDEMVNLSTHLNEARMRAEALAQGVTSRAEQVNMRKAEREKKLEEFRLLADKVRNLNSAMSQLRPPAGEKLADEERAKLPNRLAEFETQLNPLIEAAQNLRKEAHGSKMKYLEQNADSLTQTLQAVRQKLVTLHS